MLEHPAAIADRVSLLEGVLEEHGPDYLGTYRPPELSWEDVKQLTGPGTVGLGLGNQVARIAGEEEMMALPGAAPGSLTIEAPRDEETEGPGGAALVASAADLDELD